ncbi:MAG: hypothetical protein HC822_06345 [Oscillochloris sp.]|nr:hypothetical protein [Oscillochloris sp.]
MCCPFDTLAAAVGLSERQFERLCRVQVGAQLRGWLAERIEVRVRG